jgi:hypothetical protein
MTPLDALVLGGDRRAMAVLRETPRLFRAIRIELAEPSP